MLVLVFTELTVAQVNPVDLPLLATAIFTVATTPAPP
jgi:hypothetical protein